MPSRAEKKRGGRPAKFAEPSRPVTMTLPERVLESLSAVDADRAKAITKLTDSALGSIGKALPPVAKIKIAEGQAIILVSDSVPLRRLPWLRLIEVAPARHLISVHSGTSIETMEVALQDLLDEVPRDRSRERAILDELLQLIRNSRRARTTLKEEILFVGTDD